MEFSYNELRCKEVINVICGKRLGRICDIIISGNNKCVLGLVVPGERKLFHNREDIFIPWQNINKIGEDCILVSIDLSSCTNLIKQPKPPKCNYDVSDGDYILD